MRDRGERRPTQQEAPESFPTSWDQVCRTAVWCRGSCTLQLSRSCLSLGTDLGEKQSFAAFQDTEILGCCLRGTEILPAREKGALRPSCLQKPGLLALLDLRERLISFTWSASLASPSLPCSPTLTDSQNSLPLDSRN